MPLQFCPKCNNLLILENNNLICQHCKTSTPTTQTTQIIQTEKNQNPKTKIGITPTQETGHDFKCEKCGNTKAKLTDLGCMIGDEDWIYLLECTKCGWGTRIGNWC